MQKDDSIQDLESFHITSFLWRNKKWEKRFEPIRNDFGYQFVDDVANSDGPIFVQCTGIILLRNKSQEGRVER